MVTLSIHLEPYSVNQSNRYILSIKAILLFCSSNQQSLSTQQKSHNIHTLKVILCQSQKQSHHVHQLMKNSIKAKLQIYPSEIYFFFINQQINCSFNHQSHSIYSQLNEKSHSVHPPFDKLFIQPNIMLFIQIAKPNLNIAIHPLLNKMCRKAQRRWSN